MEDGREFGEIRREVDHKIPVETLTVEAVGPRNKGGSPTRYEILTPDKEEVVLTLDFQSQPTHEGWNGVTNEALLAVLIDRMEGFVEGPFSCDENEDILGGLVVAQDAAKRRFEDRVERGVFDKQKA